MPVSRQKRPLSPSPTTPADPAAQADAEIAVLRSKLRVRAWRALFAVANTLISVALASIGMGAEWILGQVFLLVISNEVAHYAIIRVVTDFVLMALALMTLLWGIVHGAVSTAKQLHAEIRNFTSEED